MLSDGISPFGIHTNLWLEYNEILSRPLAAQQFDLDSFHHRLSYLAASPWQSATILFNALDTARFHCVLSSVVLPRCHRRRRSCTQVSGIVFQKDTSHGGEVDGVTIINQSR